MVRTPNKNTHRMNVRWKDKDWKRIEKYREHLIWMFGVDVSMAETIRVLVMRGLPEDIYSGSTDDS